MSDTQATLGMQDFGSDTSHQNHLDFLAQRKLNQRNHATLVKIVRAPYDASGNTITPGSAVSIGFVDVLPLINQVDGNGLPIPHETVYHLQYFRYQGGHNAFICDPAVNDIGKMVIADRDTSLVKATSQQSNPGSGRRGNFADGTYIGMCNGTGPSQYFAWLNQGFVIVDSFGNHIQSTNAGVIINGVTISKTGDITTSSVASYNVHTHSGVTTGTGHTGVPDPSS